MIGSKRREQGNRPNTVIYVLLSMNNENKNESCKCKELAEKLVVSVKGNERLAKMMRDLKQENERLKVELRNGCSACSGTGSSRDDKGYKEKFEALVEINHSWKKDYEELQMRFEMLKGEKRPLEDEVKETKLRISELEQRQGPLQSELARLAGTLYAQQSKGSSNGGPSEEQCEILKSQMIVYKEDFDKERKDREKLREKKEKYKHKLEDAEEIIRKLTSELDACKAREEARRASWAENGYLSERAVTPPRFQVQYVHPYQSVDQRWKIEQQRRRIRWKICPLL